LSKQRADYYRKNREHIRAQRKRQYDEAYPVDPAPWRAARDRRRVRVKMSMTVTDRRLSLAYRRAIAGDPCRFCGDPGATAIDHYYPLAKGGTDVWFNLTSACRACNASKHAKCGTRFALLRGGSFIDRVFPQAQLAS
jgi:5-methylcytosine-specific restriction endonuclease McrA